MADVEDYLQEGFDARSVTVPRLRSILVTHNVDYPSTAKKPQLVELVNDHVLSQASKLRAQRAKAKRSSLGFINAGSADDSNTWEEHDNKSRQSSTRRSMSPRKSSGRAKAEREERKRGSRSVSRQLGAVDEDDGEASVASKASRRSRRTVTPQIKAESDIEEEENSVIHHDVLEQDEDDEEEEEEDDDDEVGQESVFTDDNPFQSGSSPPPVVTPSSRRRTLGDEVSKTSKSARRRTDGPIERPKTPRSSNVSRRSRTKTPEFALDPSEEFTAEEQLELEESHAASDGAVTRRKPAGAARQSSVLTPLFVLFMALLGAYGAWYRQEKMAVGYCGLGRHAQQLLPPDIQVPDALLPFIEPQCEPCPQNAYCYEGFTVRCVPGFIQKPHPLSLGGLIPLPPTCEPDSEQERRVQAVADKAVEELRERRAKYECGDLVDEAGQQEDSPAIAEDELKEAVSKKRNKRLSDEEFDDLWEKAVGKVTTRDEIEVEEETSTTEAPDSSAIPNRKLSSTSLARLSFTCAVKRSIRLGLARNRFAIGLLISLVLGVFYVRARYHRHVTTSAQVPALVDMVLGRLANQKELGEEELDDPWLFLPNLRDDILRSVHSLTERERIWQRVRAVVEQNSNVRTGQRESRNGEVGRAWEWIGPVKGDGARRRRSGRVSWLPNMKEETPDGQKVGEMKKWEESRPIY